MEQLVQLFVQLFYLGTQDWLLHSVFNRDPASSWLCHSAEVTVVFTSHLGSFFDKVLIFNAKRWQYFTEYVSASTALVDYQDTLLYGFLFFCLKLEGKSSFKKLLKNLWTVYNLLHFYIPNFYNYFSLMDWILLVVLPSCLSFIEL